MIRVRILVMEDLHPNRMMMHSYPSREITPPEMRTVSDMMEDQAWWQDLTTNGKICNIDKYIEYASLSYVYLFDFMLPEGEETLFVMRHGVVPNLWIVPNRTVYEEWQDPRRRLGATR